MIAYHDAPYLEILQELTREFKTNGTHENRTAIQTASLFSREMRFNLAEGFPLLTTKRVHTHSVIHELIWMLNGDTNVKYLQDNGVRIWNEWANEEGELGPVYGRNWRKWPALSWFSGMNIEQEAIYDEMVGDPGMPDMNCTADILSYLVNRHSTIDQIANALWQLRNDPFSRRIIVSAWDPSVVQPPMVKDAPRDLPKKGYAALPSCHTLFQFVASRQPGTDRLKLNCKLFQRSADFLLGVPFNIAFYSLLTHMVADVVDMDVGEFVWSGTDVHLYANHIEQAKLQLSREARPSPKLILKNVPKDLRFPDGIGDMAVEFEGYYPQPAIKATVAV